MIPKTLKENLQMAEEDVLIANLKVAVCKEMEKVPHPIDVLIHLNEAFVEYFGERVNSSFHGKSEVDGFYARFFSPQILAPIWLFTQDKNERHSLVGELFMWVGAMLIHHSR